MKSRKTSSDATNEDSSATFAGDTRGSVALMMALAIACIAIAIGLAIDFANAVSARDRLQHALDAAVLAGASDSGASWRTNAQQILAGQLQTDELTGLTATFSKDNAGVVSARASREVRTYFGGLISAMYVPVAVQATAAASAPPADPVCILVKNPSAGQALLVNSGAVVQAPNCQIHVASTASPAAIFNAGSNIQTTKICIAGGNIIDNGGTHPNLERNCQTVSDPFAGNLPSPGSLNCTFNGGNWNGGTVNMKPGVYCGWFNFNGAPTVNFEPGLYVIRNGGFNVNGGTWSGNDVTFHFADSSTIQFNSAVRAYLKAPTSGTYSGILIYEPHTAAQSNFILNDSAGHELEGLIYLPNRNVTINSGAHATLDKLTMVVNTLILNSMNWSVGPYSRRPLGTTGSGRGVVRLAR